MAKKRLTTRGVELLNDYDPTHRTTKLGDRMANGERRVVNISIDTTNSSGWTAEPRTVLKALGQDYLIESILAKLDKVGTDAGAGGDDNTLAINALIDGAAITGVTARDFDPDDAVGLEKDLVDSGAAVTLAAGKVLALSLTETQVNPTGPHVVGVQVTYSPITEDETP